MIQMVRGSLKNNYQSFCIALVLSLGVIFLANSSVQAKQPNSFINLDKVTMERGYTNELNDLRVGVPAGTFSSAADFLLREKKNYPNLPKYLEPVSSAYVYSIDIANPGYTASPIWLSYEYEEDPKYQRNFYYYDGTSEWVKLPTNLDTVNNRVRAAWHFSYSIIGVFDDTRYDVGPIKKDSYSDFGGIASTSAIAIDNATGVVLYEKDANTKRSIASLTKLMTAYVLLQNDVNLEKEIIYSSSYDQIGARLRLNSGDIVSMDDLMYAMVVGSANNAAYALMYEGGYSKEQFVKKMNKAAKNLGLSNTTFADPSGLDANNQSTAADYAKFMRSIMSDPKMLHYSTTKAYAFTTRNTGEYHDFDNTNALMKTSDLYITGSKTGYLDEAGYCLAFKAKEGDDEVITVVLGASSGWARFTESERLMRWAFTNYSWQ